MGQVTEEIENAKKLLGLTNDDIILLDKERGREIFDQLLAHFVTSGDRRWWWEDFRQESFSFKHHDYPFELLNEIMPETNTKVWLMVEDDYEEFYPIYETRPEIIKDIIGECFGFEYYIVDKDKEWLICENHHDRLIGIGERLRTKNLARIVD